MLGVLQGAPTSPCMEGDHVTLHQQKSANPAKVAKGRKVHQESTVRIHLLQEFSQTPLTEFSGAKTIQTPKTILNVNVSKILISQIFCVPLSKQG